MGPTNREISLAITMKDGVTSIWNKVAGEVRSGISTLSGDFSNLTVAVDKQGSAYDRLLSRAKTDRMEKRAQTFMLKEAMHATDGLAFAVTALAGSAGEAGGAMGQLQKSTLDGMATFYGLKFVLGGTGIGTPLAATIAGATALASAMGEISKNSAKAKAGLEDALVAIGKLDRVEMLKGRAATREKIEPSWLDSILAGFYGPAAFQAKEKIAGTAAAQETTAQIREALEIEKATSAEAKEQVDVAKLNLDLKKGTVAQAVKALEAYKATLMSEHQVRTSAIDRLRIEVEIAALRAGEAKKGLKEIGPEKMHEAQIFYINNEQTERFKRNQELINFLNQSEDVRHMLVSENINSELTAARAGLAKLKTVKVEPLAGVTEEMTRIDVEWQALLSGVDSGVMAVVDDLSKGVGKMWDDTFGEATSLLQKFGQAIAVEMARVLSEYFVKKAVGSLFSWIPGLGPVLGAIFGNSSNPGAAVPAASDTVNGLRGQFSQAPAIALSGKVDISNGMAFLQISMPQYNRWLTKKVA